MKKIQEINWLRIFNRSAKSFLTALLLILSAQAVFYAWIVDPHNYTHYTAVEPSKKTIWIGEEDLFFRSFATVYKDSNLRWEDILNCDIKGDEYEGGYFSKYDSDKTHSKPARWEGKGVWRYGGATPIQPATCTLRSTTFVVFKIFFVFDLDRSLNTINSNESVQFKRKTP